MNKIIVSAGEPKDLSEFNTHSHTRSISENTMKVKCMQLFQNTDLYLAGEGGENKYTGMSEHLRGTFFLQLLHGRVCTRSR